MGRAARVNRNLPNSYSDIDDKISIYELSQGIDLYQHHPSLLCLALGLREAVHAKDAIEMNGGELQASFD